MQRIVAFAALGLAGLVLAGCTTTSNSGPALGLVEPGQSGRHPNSQLCRTGSQQLGPEEGMQRRSCAR